MADNGVSHFLENGPRIFWKEQTIGLFPWPQPSTYTGSCSAMLAPLLTPLHLGVLRRGIGGQMGMGQAPLFICICILKLCRKTC